MDFDCENSYDIIFDLKSLSKLDEGFEIIYSKEGKGKCDELRDIKDIIISAIGNTNKGKTYILSKIFETKLPFGYSTKGISMKYLQKSFKENNSNKNYIILDTEGSEKGITLSNEDKNEINKLNGIEKIERINKIIIDRKMTEDFIQNFAIDSANFVIAVVGELTFQEQKFINRIKDYCRNKNLYIIHNLKYLKKKEEVENYMKNIIEASLFFNVRKNKMIRLKEGNGLDMNTYFYVEIIKNEYKNEEKYIIHLIMGKEGSEAGNYYNQSTIKFMRDSCHALFQQKKFDLIKQFSKYLCLYLNDYFYLSQIDLLEKNQDNFELITRKNIEIDENNIFKVNFPYDLKLRIIDIDIIGIKYKSKIPSLPYSYYKKDDKFIIQIEYFGKVVGFEIKTKIFNGQYNFTIIVKTVKYTRYLYSKMKEDLFMIFFSVGLNFITIKSNDFEEKNNEKSGILNIIYEIESYDDDYLGDDDNW